MEMGYRTFEENFMECCEHSCSRLAYERQQQSLTYQSADSRCSELYSRIKEKLGEDGALINQFDAAKNHLLSLGDMDIYQQGMRDCVYLLRFIGIL